MKLVLPVLLALVALGCRQRGEPLPRAASAPVTECAPGARRPHDRCDDCVCTPGGRWQCSPEPCVGCPDGAPGSEWVNDANATLCCQFAPAAVLPAGWQPTSEQACHERVAPGLWRAEPAPAVAPGVATFSIEFAVRQMMFDAKGRAVVEGAAQKAAANPSEPVTVRPLVVIGETPVPMVDAELGRARAANVRQALIRAGLDGKRVKIDPVEQVRNRSVGGVDVLVKEPPPAVVTAPCVDGVTAVVTLGSLAAKTARLELCRNDTCAALRLDLAALRGRGENTLLFALPPPLSGGVRVEHHPQPIPALGKSAGFDLVIRVNAPKGTLKNGDGYRMTIQPVDGAARPLGFSTRVSYPARADECLDAMISPALEQQP